VSDATPARQKRGEFSPQARCGMCVSYVLEPAGMTVERDAERTERESVLAKAGRKVSGPWYRSWIETRAGTFS
jgi:hypothetical protein